MIVRCYQNWLKENIIISNKIIRKLFADDGGYDYDNNEIFRRLSDNGILACIKVRKNASKNGMEKRTHP